MEEQAIARDATYGFRRLDPIPLPDESSRFYESNYYDLIRAGDRAPDLRRLAGGGREAEEEAAWLRTTLYEDIRHVLDRHAPGKRLLDVGCGVGEFVAYMQKAGYAAFGVEPSDAMASMARQRGLHVHDGTLEEYVGQHRASGSDPFDVVVLLNVLEHVPDPVGVIDLTRELLGVDGILTIRVPNDFTELQEAARKALGSGRWWIAVPDHINYFDFSSLHALIEGEGFEVAYSQGDFPMEAFLLMGDDYVRDTSLGGVCHEKRRRFELAIPGELRRRIYHALALEGVGRDCLVFAKRGPA